MNNNIRIINITSDNIAQYPATCFLSPKHSGYRTKLEWIKKQFLEGMKIKLLYRETKCIGFIEYIPGEKAFRAVEAKGYLFIHCIWISQNKYKRKGYGSLLIKECLDEAIEEDKYGVAVITSEGPFMAGRDVFLKNGFKSVAKADPSFDLMVKVLKKGPLPEFKNVEKRLRQYNGLNIIYSKQCPWVVRSIIELKPVIKNLGLKVRIKELKTAVEAQNAPSVYSCFSLIYNGKLLADHYISTTRFRNIIKKDK